MLLDIPKNPPPLPALGFTPRQGYVPSMPSPLSTLEEQLPTILAAAQQSLQTLREIVARVPASLDRSDRFFTNVERIRRESQLPELSASLRTFSTSTTTGIAQMTANMAQITANMDRIAGAEGTLLKLAEEARSAIHDADVPASSQAARDAAERTILAEIICRSLPAILRPR